MGLNGCVFELQFMVLDDKACGILARRYSQVVTATDSNLYNLFLFEGAGSNPAGVVFFFFMDPVLLASFFFLIAIACSWPLCKTRDDARARAALQALLTIITPSCSLWPSRYTRLVKQASISPDNRIMLPLHSFVQDVLDGAIELRDPLNNLVDLTRATGIDANGWNVCLRVGSRSWVSTLKFRLAHKVDRKIFPLDYR